MQEFCAKQVHVIKTWSDQAVVMNAKKHKHFLNEERNICFPSFSFQNLSSSGRILHFEIRVTYKNCVFV